jgi:crotonobetainyl-CoA:carnitine CoA-transferase CaiB-like acyl-CoA transferase
MKNLISKTANYISSVFNKLQIKYFLAVALVGFSLLTTNAALAHENTALKERVRERVEENDTQRPKTVGEWNQDARETEGSPGKRVQKIGQQSAEALKEFGSGYIDGAKETARDIGDSAAQMGEDISNKVR